MRVQLASPPLNPREWLNRIEVSLGQGLSSQGRMPIPDGGTTPRAEKNGRPDPASTAPTRGYAVRC